ncbi:hypothetical protein OG548_41990 [Streptomyces sp. NBC_01356]|nr:hypothetical protein [Streptomyces sp. NBC_01356]
MLVHGALGGVGSLAAQLARWGGATVIGTVRRSSDLDGVDPAIVDLDNAVTAPDAVIAAYGTHTDRTELPF